VCVHNNTFNVVSMHLVTLKCLITENLCPPAMVIRIHYSALFEEYVVSSTMSVSVVTVAGICNSVGGVFTCHYGAGAGGDYVCL